MTMWCYGETRGQSRAHLEPTGTTQRLDRRAPAPLPLAAHRLQRRSGRARHRRHRCGDDLLSGADTDELQVYTDTHEFNPEMHAIEQPDYYPLLVDKR